MANLFKMELGTLGPFVAALSGAGLSAEMAEEVSKNPSLAGIMVAALPAARQKVIATFTVLVTYLIPSYANLKKAFDWVNGAYASAKFEAIERCRGIDRTSREVAFRYFKIGRSMTTEQVLDAMDAAGLRPAIYEELLAFASKYPDEQRGKLIVALGSVARIDGYLLVASLLENDHGRRLNLVYGDPGSWWYGNCVFLAVSK